MCAYIYMHMHVLRVRTYAKVKVGVAPSDTRIARKVGRWVGGLGTEWHQNIKMKVGRALSDIMISKVRWPLTAGSSEVLYR